MDELPRSGAAVRDLDLPLPPGPMPLFRGARPLKRWHYVGVYGPELMLCAADVHIGPLRQQWWAAATPDGAIRGRTSLRSAGVRIDGTYVKVASAGARIEIDLTESAGREVVQPRGGRGYVWTRKQAGVPARGFAELDGRRFDVAGEAVVDQTAGYHERHTTWRWSAGVGRGAGGERVAWNLVSGVNDSLRDSERAVWVDGADSEPAPVEFAADLSRIAFAEGGELRFSEWAAREERTNLLVVRSSYRQPFGTFAGELPGGVRLAEAYGVMEWHDVHW
jgi:Protein of unknown function (DUF2804)